MNRLVVQHTITWPLYTRKHGTPSSSIILQLRLTTSMWMYLLPPFMLILYLPSHYLPSFTLITSKTKVLPNALGPRPFTFKGTLHHILVMILFVCFKETLLHSRISLNIVGGQHLEICVPGEMQTIEVYLFFMILTWFYRIANCYCTRGVVSCKEPVVSSTQNTTIYIRVGHRQITSNKQCFHDLTRNNIC